MSRPELGKWKIIWRFEKEFDRMESGWRKANVGLVKFTSYPREGVSFTKAHYDGFWLKWRYWLPFEGSR